MKDATALWQLAIYAIEQAIINSNCLCDLRTDNSVSESPLESIIELKLRCGVFLDVPFCDIDRQATIEDLGAP
ncbi:MAG: hypothetical protein EZS28_040654, partial [Streblomastix strix]